MRAGAIPQFNNYGSQIILKPVNNSLEAQKKFLPINSLSKTTDMRKYYVIITGKVIMTVNLKYKKN